MKVHYGKRKYYQPTITRLPSLLSLLALTLGLIAIIQYAIVKLPNHDSNGLLSSIANKTVDEAKEILSARDAHLFPRQTTIPAEATPLVGSPSVNIKAGSGPVTPVTSAVAPSNYLPVVGDSPVTTTALPSNYLPVGGNGGPSSPSPSNPKYPHYAAPSDYVSIGDDPTTPPVYESAAASDYLSVGKGGGTSAAAPSGYLPIDGGKTVPPPTAAPTAYLSINNNPKPKVDTPGNVQPAKTGSPGEVSAQAADPTNYVSVAGGGNPTSTPVTIYHSATASDYLPVGETTPGAASSSDYQPVDSSVHRTEAPFQSNYLSAVNPKSGGIILTSHPAKDLR